MRSVRFHLEVEKDYVALCLKKWLVNLSKEDLIPKLDCEFYISECVKFPNKKAAILYCLVENTNELSFDIYIEKLYSWLSIFKAKMVKED